MGIAWADFWLGDYTVAMTRPKRHLCVVGDGETVGKGSGFLKRWMGFLEAEADLRYPDVGALQREG